MGKKQGKKRKEKKEKVIHFRNRLGNTVLSIYASIYTSHIHITHTHTHTHTHTQS